MEERRQDFTYDVFFSYRHRPLDNVITKLRKGDKGEGLKFYGPEEALVAYNEGKVAMHAIISVVVDAPENLISSVSGKLGMLDGVSAKTTYSRLAGND